MRLKNKSVPVNHRDTKGKVELSQADWNFIRRSVQESSDSRYIGTTPDFMRRVIHRKFIQIVATKEATLIKTRWGRVIARKKVEPCLFAYGLDVIPIGKELGEIIHRETNKGIIFSLIHTLGFEEEDNFLNDGTNLFIGFWQSPTLFRVMIQFDTEANMLYRMDGKITLSKGNYTLKVEGDKSVLAIYRQNLQNMEVAIKKLESEVKALKDEVKKEAKKDIPLLDVATDGVHGRTAGWHRENSYKVHPNIKDGSIWDANSGAWSV